VKVSALLNPPPQASNPKLAYQESNQSDSNEDAMIAKIKELELENKKLKMGTPYGAGDKPAEDKNWLNSGFGGNTSQSNFYKSGTNRPANAGVATAGGMGTFAG